MNEAQKTQLIKKAKEYFKYGEEKGREHFVNEIKSGTAFEETTEELIAVFVEAWYTERLTYSEFSDRMREHNRENNIKSKSYDEPLIGVIVINKNAFKEDFSLEERSYSVSSNNKAYIAGMNGYSIYGSSLDGTDICVRLDRYIKEENGGADGWEIDYCYIL